MKSLAKQTGNAPPAWLWITALLSIAAFAGLLMYLDYHQKRDFRTGAKSHSQSPESHKQSPAASKSKGKTLPGDGNKFDFYQLLPDLEQVISDKEAVSSQAKKPKNDKKSSPTLFDDRSGQNAQEYYLQAGAFTQYQAADRMKASLALLGLKASIQRVDIGNVGRVHRVRLGPFSSIEQMQRVQDKLKAGHIPSIMVKSKVTH